VTVVVTDNPELREFQLRGVMGNIAKCLQELSDLSNKLREREDGKIRRGRQYTLESVNSKVKTILSQEHMKNIFDYSAYYINKNIVLTYNINDDKFNYIKEFVLGKTTLFTNRDNWTNEQIISAYRSQYHVEECFKQLKNNDYLSFRPIRHFIDNNITIYAFYCVLTLTLTSILKLELKKLGYDYSINNILK
jgi:transposase